MVYYHEASNAGNSNKRSAAIGLNTREVQTDKYSPYISYGEYSFVDHVLTNYRQLLIYFTYISNDKNHLYKLVTSKTFLVAITRSR